MKKLFKDLYLIEDADKKYIFKDARPDGQYDPQQLQWGIEIEMEHSDDEDIAKRIAKDHLDELPDYYTRLRAMEREAGITESMGYQGPVKTVRFLRKESGSGYGVDSINYIFHDGETGDELIFDWSAMGYEKDLSPGGLYRIQWWNTTNTASWGQRSGWKVLGRA